MQRCFRKFLSVMLLGLLAWLCFVPLGLAQPVQGFSPSRYETTLNYGTGVYFAPYETRIYQEPRDDSPLVDVLTWGRSNNVSASSLTVFSKVRKIPIRATHVFLSFFPALDVAIMAVLQENGAGWAEVLYDQPQHKTGWVKLGEVTVPESMQTAVANRQLPTHFGQFQSWIDFMKLNAKANGIYWLEGVSSYDQSLRTAPEDTAKLVDVTMIKKIKVRHVRGNWLLVEVLDFGRTMPMGWIRWRDEEGRLMVFTNFTGEFTPVVMSSF